MPSKKQTDVSGGDRQPDETLTFCSLENLKVAQVQVVGGTLNGFSIGFVAVYAYFYLISTDCSMYKKEVACNRVLNAECSWNKTRGECGWNGFTCFWGHGKDKAACLDDSRCKWVYSDEECKNPTGYSSSYNGIFAGAMIVGAMIGSIYAGQFAARFGHKVSFLIVGIVGVVSSVMYHVSSATNEFWVLCVGRLLIGVVLGLVNVACPMYVDQNAHPKFLHVDGVLFQVFTTFGIMFAAAMGLAIGQSVNFDKDIKMDARMQGYCAFSTLLSVLMVALGIFLGESKTKFTSGKHEDDGTALDPKRVQLPADAWTFGDGTSDFRDAATDWHQCRDELRAKDYGQLGDGASCGQLRGDGVELCDNSRLDSTCPGPHDAPAVSWCLACGVSCLLLCGVPVYPGVADKNVKNGVAITGIAVFIAAFEIGLGPCFFVLAQELFPRSFRPRGSSFVLLTNFIFNVIINVCYQSRRRASLAARLATRTRVRQSRSSFLAALVLSASFCRCSSCTRGRRALLRTTETPTKSPHFQNAVAD
ncbi:hexose transporter [Trypanosoma cruzi]|nr:hexose transporter [Trypanosoma cruzi]